MVQGHGDLQRGEVVLLVSDGSLSRRMVARAKDILRSSKEADRIATFAAEWHPVAVTQVTYSDICYDVLLRIIIKISQAISNV